MKRRPRAEGFSLHEVLIALTVFGFTGIALTSMVLLNLRTNREAKEKTVASSIAQSRIEEFRKSSVTAPTVGTNMSDGSVTVDGLNYTRTLTVSTTGLPTGVALFTVKIAWREPEVPGLSLTTYVTY